MIQLRSVKGKPDTVIYTDEYSNMRLNIVNKWLLSKFLSLNNYKKIVAHFSLMSVNMKNSNSSLYLYSISCTRPRVTVAQSG